MINTKSVIVVIITSILVALISINNCSLWMDESSTAFLAHSTSLKDLIANMDEWHGSEKQMPGYILSIFMWDKVFGDSEYSLRCFNLLPWSFLIIYIIYIIRRDDIYDSIKNKYILLLLLSTISPFILYNMNEARVNISIYVLGFITLSSAYLYRIYENKYEIIFFVSCLIIGFSYNMLFILILLPSLLILQKQTINIFLKYRIVSLITIILLGIEGCYFLYTLLEGSGGMKERPSIINIGYTLYEFMGFGGMGIPKEEMRVSSDLLNDVLPYKETILLMFISYLMLFIQNIKLIFKSKTTYIFIICLILFYIVSFFANFRFWGRHLFMFYPIFIYLLAESIISLYKRGNILSRITLGFVFISLIISSYRIVFNTDYKKEDIKLIVKQINKLSTDYTIYWGEYELLANYYGLKNFKRINDYTPSSTPIVVAFFKRAKNIDPISSPNKEYIYKSKMSYVYIYENN